MIQIVTEFFWKMHLGDWFLGDFPMDSQMKIFVDDFNEERSEKEKQWKENLEIKGENTRLKHKVDELVSLLVTIFICVSKYFCLQLQ